MLPECGFEGCALTGPHLCDNRADHVRSFFLNILRHTKGRYAGQPFELHGWQFNDIVRPLFGEVVYSPEVGGYVRRYTIAWIEIARKNGKSELLAGIMIYLLVADGEKSGEIYGIARDQRQASLVYDVAKEMIRMSPALRAAVKTPTSIKRMVHLKSNSVYQVIASDGDTALGSNPSGVAADELLSWRDRSMWDAMETGLGSGARLQPLLAAATTAGVTNGKFGELQHKTMARIAEDPSLSPHTFTYIRNNPPDVDIMDEAAWRHANPALGTFLSLESFRRAAADAKMDPEREQAFRQFRLNSWGKGSFAWMPMDRYDAANRGGTWSRPDENLDALRGRQCFIGLDLSSKMDLTAVAWLFPSTDFGVAVRWRFYAPEEAIVKLDEHNDGAYSKYVQQGWLKMHDGAVVDFDDVVADIAEDAKIFAPAGLDADEWSTWPLISAAAKAARLNVDTQVAAYKSTYTHLSSPMHDVMAMVKNGSFTHFGNPLARACFRSCEGRRSLVDPDLIRPDKPAREKEHHRIDAVPAVLMAAGAWKTRGTVQKRRSAYEDHGVTIA